MAYNVATETPVREEPKKPSAQDFINKAAKESAKVNLPAQQLIQIASLPKVKVIHRTKAQVFLEKGGKFLGEQSQQLNKFTKKKILHIKEKKAGEETVSKKGLPALRTRKTTVSDKIKLLRFANRLEKLRLQNTLERYKLRLQLSKSQGKGIPIKLPRVTPLQIRQPIYSSHPTIQSDVEGAFNADIDTNENLFGPESWFGDEPYYTEEYFADEFNLTPFQHLNIKPRPGMPPFFW